MDNKIARINSKLYFDLYQKGGDRLIAVYAILKTSREGLDKYYSFTSKNNKTVSGYALLRSKTILTLHTITKYVPLLIEMGLCNIQDNGNVFIVGGEKLKKAYKNTKLVPIVIGKNVNNTADNSLSVRLFSAKYQQEREINNKKRRSELLKQLSNPTNNKLYKKAVKLSKKLEGKEITVLDEVVLSNQGYALLKNNSADKKSMGCYWKQKLVKKGLVESKRRFKKLKRMSYGEYLGYIDSYPNRRAVYKNGFLCQEEVATLSPIDLTIVKDSLSIKEVKVKGLKHLQFDMIAFWQNN